MTKRAVAFKQADLTRALKAALAAHITVTRTEIMPDGRITIFHADPAAPAATPFDAWKAGRDAH